ncbi:MAG: CapA family protein [Alistipes sp.]|nr:CapA family protein [Alistipes sp.]
MRIVVAILFMLALSFAPFAIKPNVEVVQNGVDSTTLRHRVRIVAAGDLMMHTPQLSAARQQNGEYDFSNTFEFVTPYFQDADIAIVNLETTLAERPPYAGYPCFRSPKAVAGAMRDAGIDVVALANNHCCDGGSSGIRTTIKTLDSLGFKRLGVYADSVDYNCNNILYLKQNNISFAIVNYTYGTNGLPVPRGMIVNRIDTVAMASDFAAAKRRGVDCLVAVVHWGNEYERKPNREQQRLADFMRRHGVDIILGSHPHVVQRVEADSVDGVTLWSMGNFVSNQSKRYCNGGLMGVIDVERVGDGPLRYKLNVVPVWVKRPEYKIIPQPIGDTMQMGAYYRQIYDLFMADTKSLLSI